MNKEMDEYIFNEQDLSCASYKISSIQKKRQLVKSELTVYQPYDLCKSLSPCLALSNGYTICQSP